MKYYSKSLFDHSFSLQGVNSSIRYANFDRRVQRKDSCIYTGKKQQSKPEKLHRRRLCVFSNYGVAFRLWWVNVGLG